MKISINTKLYKYFNGHQKNIYGTILTHSGYIDHNVGHKDTRVKTPMSILIFYDHRKLRVERYLLNIGNYTDVMVINNKEHSKFSKDFVFKDKSELYDIEPYGDNSLIKYIYREDDMINTNNKLLKYHYDGKMNKYFIYRFLLLLIYDFINNRDKSFSKMFDLNIINNLSNRGMDVDMLFEWRKSPLDKQYFPLDMNKNMIINIPQGIYSLLKDNVIYSQKLNNINIEAYTSQDLPDVVKDLKSILKLKTITSANELDERIIKFNKLNIKRYDIMLNDLKKRINKKLKE